VKSFILILIILNIYYESINLKILKKNKITNSDLWASEWFEKHKNYLTSMTEQQIKFRLNQELAKHSRINQKTFDDILQFILMKKKQLFLSNKKYSIIFQLLRY
jgi:hypothetical protein